MTGFDSLGGPFTGVDKPSKSELYDFVSTDFSAAAADVLFGVVRDDIFGLLEFA